MSTTTAYDFGLSSVLTDQLSNFITDVADCDDYYLYSEVKQILLVPKSGATNQSLQNATGTTTPFYGGCLDQKYFYSSSTGGALYFNKTWNYNYTYTEGDTEKYEIEEMNKLDVHPVTTTGRAYYCTNISILVHDDSGQTVNFLTLIDSTTIDDDEPDISYVTVSLGSCTNGFQFVNYGNGIQYAIKMDTSGTQVTFTNKDRVNQTIQLDQQGQIPIAKSNFESPFIPVLNNNMIYFYQSKYDSETKNISIEKYGSFDLKSLYMMFNLTDSYVSVNDMLTVNRAQLYKQDTLIITSKMSEFEETSDTLVALYRIIDGQLDYFWTSAPAPQDVRSNSLDTVYFLNDYKIYKLQFDGLINAVDSSVKDTTYTDSCWLHEQYLQISDPFVTGESTLTLTIDTENPQCNNDTISLYYKDQYQTIGYTYNQDKNKATATLILAPQVKSYEITSPSLPFIDQDNHYIGSYVFLQNSGDNFYSCYELTSQFDLDIIDNTVYWYPNDNQGLTSCYYDFPSIYASVEYKGYNYTKKLDPDNNPSMTEVNSYSSLFDPDQFPGFNGDLFVYITVICKSVSGLVVGNTTTKYDDSPELISCYSKKQNVFASYYGGAYHLTTINASVNKFVQPCTLDTDDIDIIDVNTTIGNLENNTIVQLTTDEFSTHQIDLHNDYISPQIEILPEDIPTDLQRFLKLDPYEDNQQILSSHLLIQSDEDDLSTATEFDFDYINMQQNCMWKAGYFNLYHEGDYIYLDLSGDGNCNKNNLPIMGDLTLHIYDQDDCDFAGIIDQYIYRSECDYDNNYGYLEYALTMNIYWKDYEIEEDYTFMYPINVPDHDQADTLWELYISLLVCIPGVVYIIGIIVYYLVANNIKFTVFEDKKYQELDDRSISFSLDDNSDDILQQSSEDNLFNNQNDDEFDDYDNQPEQIIEKSDDKKDKKDKKKKKVDKKTLQQQQQKQLMQEGLFTLPE